MYCKSEFYFILLYFETFFCSQFLTNIIYNLLCTKDKQLIISRIFPLTFDLICPSFYTDILDILFFFQWTKNSKILANLFGVVGPILVTIYAMPWILFVLFPLTMIYANLQARYRHCSRDLKRIGKIIHLYIMYRRSQSGVLFSFLHEYECVFYPYNLLCFLFFSEEGLFIIVSLVSFTFPLLSLLFFIFLCGLEISSILFSHFYLCLFIYLIIFCFVPQ